MENNSSSIKGGNQPSRGTVGSSSGMYKFQILKYYSQPFVQNKISEFAKGREVVGRLEDDRYARRPDVILYPKDVQEKVKQGAVSFHCSVERWRNPMQLSSEMRESEMRELRSGWDFILDIDAREKIEHARIATQIIVSFLKDFGITPSVKFSGRRGFHIGISWDAFPKRIDLSDTAKLYPEATDIIKSFIKEKTNGSIMDALISYEGGVAKLYRTFERTSKLSSNDFINVKECWFWEDSFDDTGNQKISPDHHSEREVGWGSRHLFRMPYSLHEKTWLASVPLSEKQLKKFEASSAKPESIRKFDSVFLGNMPEEAAELLVQALEWQAKQTVPEARKQKIHNEIKKEIPEEFFPPCVKNILAGISDGRKRSVFTLSAFLRHMNWVPENIEKRVEEWNARNQVSISPALVRSQLKWHLRQNRKILPANCDSDLFYKSIGVCKPDGACARLKNPINYAFRAYRRQFKTADGAIRKDGKVLRRTIKKKKEEKTNQIIHP